MADREKRQRRVYVTWEMLEAFLVAGRPAETNLPDDARLERIYPNETGGCYVFVFSSSEFDALQEGEWIPKHEMEVTAADA